MTVANDDDASATVLPFRERQPPPCYSYDETMARLQICQGDVGLLEETLAQFDEWEVSTDANDAVAKVVFEWLERRIGSYDTMTLFLDLAIPSPPSAPEVA